MELKPICHPENTLQATLKALRDHKNENLFLIDNASISSAIKTLCDSAFVIEFIQSSAVGVEIYCHGDAALKEAESQEMFKAFLNVKRSFLIMIRMIEKNEMKLYWSRQDRSEMMMLEVDGEEEEVGGFLSSFIIKEIKKGESGKRKVGK